jgi:hypothetical protein
MANRNWSNGGKIYAMHVKPAFLNATFTVAQSNGAGQTGLLGSAIGQVFMHTSGTKATYKGVTNNVAAGYAQVFMAPNFNTFLRCSATISAPLTGTNVPVTSALTVGQAYVITTVGTTTTAQYQALGLQAGITPAVGVAFIASSATPTSGTGQVQTPTASSAGTNTIEIIGSPSTTLTNLAQPTNGGGYVILRFVGPTSSAVTTPIAIQPADGAQIRLEFLFNDSSVISGASGPTAG